ncbi:MAG: glutamate-5-semialdehyde dehydrogenase [Gammaproteobacteria bacterium]
MEAGKLEHAMHDLGRKARSAARELAQTSTPVKNSALLQAADTIRHSADRLLEANAKDLAVARTRGVAEAMLDRLALDRDRMDSMAAGLVAVAELEDPVGQSMAQWQRPNGLDITRRRVPLGVIGIVYESRPNVTVDAAALCIKSGNAAILRGGSESFYSSQALYQVVNTAFDEAGLPASCIQMVPTRDRAAVGLLLGGLTGAVDLLVPRGGRSLIERVQSDARVPVLGHLEGICHVYVDRSADMSKAVDIVLNSKMRRTGICGAAETLLLDGSLSHSDQTSVVAALLDAGCEVRGDQRVVSLDPRVVASSSSDWGHEFLAPVIAARCVDGAAGAIEHIRQFGSGHTESIVGEDALAVDAFLNQVDSAIVLHNASTQFADGSEFGMGAEIGISTGKLHARGPVGVEQLTSYKYVVRGAGQTRP